LPGLAFLAEKSVFDSSSYNDASSSIPPKLSLGKITFEVSVSVSVLSSDTKELFRAAY